MDRFPFGGGERAHGPHVFPPLCRDGKTQRLEVRLAQVGHHRSFELHRIHPRRTQRLTRIGSLRQGLEQPADGRVAREALLDHEIVDERPRLGVEEGPVHFLRSPRGRIHSEECLE